MAEAGRHLLKSPGSMSLLKQGHPNSVVQGHVQSGFDRDSSGQPMPVFNDRYSKKVFSYV